MDLGTKTESWGADDQSWLLSRTGLGNARSITLDLQAFDRAKHFPDGFLKSGIPLAKRTSDGQYVPYNTSGSGGAEKLDGHLAWSVHLTNAGAARLQDVAGGALLWQGVVDVRLLPGGATVIDADAIAQVSGRIRYENVKGA